MSNGIKWIIFATGWMSFRAIGSSLILFWTITKNDRAAPNEWIVSLTGDFVIGITALFLVYFIYKKPSAVLWGILLAWNFVGLFDLYEAITTSILVPYEPIPELGLNDFGVKSVLTLNSIIHISAIYLLFQSRIKSYFNL